MPGTIAIIGGGSWGTALAIVLAPRFDRIRLWAHEADLVERMTASRENDVFLPGFQLPANVQPTTDLKSALAGAATVVGVMPSRFARPLYRAMLPHLEPEMRFVSATKGLEHGTLLRMSEVARAVIGERFAPRVAALSGPTFAREVARGEPTAVVISSEDRELAAEIQARVLRPHAAPLHQRRSHRRRDRRGAQEHHRDRRRHLPGPGTRQQFDRGAHHARPGRDHAPRGRDGRASPNTRGSGRPRGPGTHLHRRAKQEPQGRNRAGQGPQAAPRSSTPWP